MVEMWVVSRAVEWVAEMVVAMAASTALQMVDVSESSTVACLAESSADMSVDMWAMRTVMHLVAYSAREKAALSAA